MTELSPWDLVGAMGDLLKQTARERNEARAEIKSLTAALRAEREATRAILALVEARKVVESEPAIGVGTGAAGGGGGSEPPSPPPDIFERYTQPLVEQPPEPGRVDVDAYARSLWGRERPLIMDSPLMDGESDLLRAVTAEIETNHAREVWEHTIGAPVEGEGEPPSAPMGDTPSHPESDAPLSDVDPAAEEALAEMVAHTSNGSSDGFRCEHCPRGFATESGLNRHVGQAHKRARPSGLTPSQEAAQKALLDGDRYGVKPGEDGLVSCGVGTCTAKRGPDVIERHRLSMHGVG